MKVLAILLALSLQSHVVFAEEGYANLPNASERADQSGFYARVPSLHLEIVQEGVGTPDEKLASLVSDSDLKSKIEAGHFLSLQVRDLDIIPSEIKKDVTTQMIRVPFIVSVKHTQRTRIPFTDRDLYTNINPNQGTIDVAGQLLIVMAKDHLTVSVETFDDSQFLEWAGRNIPYAGINHEINLAFADAIVKPEVEGFFNGNPDEIKKMIGAYVPETTLPTLKDLEHSENQPAPPKTQTAQKPADAASAPAVVEKPADQPNVTLIEPKEFPQELNPTSNAEHIVKDQSAPASQSNVAVKSQEQVSKKLKAAVMAPEKAPAPAKQRQPEPQTQNKPVAVAQPQPAASPKTQPEPQKLSAHDAVIKDFLSGKR